MKIDVDVKAIVGLTEMGNLSKDQLIEYLEKFEKKDLIEYIFNEISESEDLEENDEEETPL